MMTNTAQTPEGITLISTSTLQQQQHSGGEFPAGFFLFFFIISPLSSSPHHTLTLAGQRGVPISPPLGTS